MRARRDFVDQQTIPTKLKQLNTKHPDTTERFHGTKSQILRLCDNLGRDHSRSYRHPKNPGLMPVFNDRIQTMLPICAPNDQHR